MSSLGPPPQILCSRPVFASPDGTPAVFGVCSKLIQIERSFGPSGYLNRSALTYTRLCNNSLSLSMTCFHKPFEMSAKRIRTLHVA